MEPVPRPSALLSRLTAVLEQVRNPSVIRAGPPDEIAVPSESFHQKSGNGISALSKALPRA